MYSNNHLSAEYLDQLRHDVRPIGVKFEGSNAERHDSYTYFSIPDAAVPYLTNQALFGFNGILDFAEKQVESFKRADVRSRLADRKARRFIKHLIGYESDRTIFNIPDGHKTESHGVSSPLGYIATRRHIKGVKLGAKERDRVMVHERSHATHVLTRKVIVLATVSENRSSATLHSAMFGGFRVAKIRPSESANEKIYIGGNFLEEAFAALCTAAYATHIDDEINKKGSVSFVADDGIDLTLPRRLVEVDSKGKMYYNQAAIPARVIELISEFTGVNIFGLMIDSRNPALEAVSKRKIIQALNSIHPKLYERMRDVSYDERSWLELYADVVSLLDDMPDSVRPRNSRGDSV